MLKSPQLVKQNMTCYMERNHQITLSLMSTRMRAASAAAIVGETEMQSRRFLVGNGTFSAGCGECDSELEPTATDAETDASDPGC
jgi:hypothetical protein